MLCFPNGTCLLSNSTRNAELNDCLQWHLLIIQIRYFEVMNCQVSTIKHSYFFFLMNFRVHKAVRLTCHSKTLFFPPKKLKDVWFWFIRISLHSPNIAIKQAWDYGAKYWGSKLLSSFLLKIWLHWLKIVSSHIISFHLNLKLT